MNEKLKETIDAKSKIFKDFLKKNNIPNCFKLKKLHGGLYLVREYKPVLEIYEVVHKNIVYKLKESICSISAIGIRLDINTLCAYVGITKGLHPNVYQPYPKDMPSVCTGSMNNNVIDFSKPEDIYKTLLELIAMYSRGHTDRGYGHMRKTAEEWKILSEEKSSIKNSHWLKKLV